MVDIYSFVLDADPLKSAGAKDRTEAQKKIVGILMAMAVQTTECAYFIRVYAEKRSFCRLVFCATSNRSDHLLY